ncbi:hypothetical protein MC885_008214 [Smutsia gigantea]|nr:hypothetical protein MC885_008214 [Smutsia gigantea]
MRLIELVDLDRKEDQDLGLYYLKQMNSSMMVVSPYNNFLNCVSCPTSTKSGPKILSDLLHLVDNKESMKNTSENDDYLKHHPEISLKVQIIRMLWQLSPQNYFTVVSKHLLYLFGHRESLLLSRSIQVFLRGYKSYRSDFSPETCTDKSQAPTIDQDYASAFEPMNVWEQNLTEKEENVKSF